MPSKGATVTITDTIQNIDQWKIYQKVNDGDFEAISANEVDFICPWVKTGDYRVYTFSYPYIIPESVNVDDIITLRFVPAGYDNTPPGVNDEWIFESDPITVTENTLSTIIVTAYKNKRRRK